MLGGVELDGERITSAASASLLAHLAANGPRPLPREQVAYALWPDRSEDRARRALSDVVYRLRGATPDGAPWLVAGADEVRLDDVEVDLWRFRELARSEHELDLVAAVDLHRGPLGEGVDDEWIELPRRAHQEAVTTVCERVASRFAPASRLGVVERWVEIDPYGVEPHHCLIETLLALDRRDAARRAIDRYRSVLDELGLDDVDVERWEALTTDSRTDALPFVGRVAERARLVRALDDACDGAGGVAVVVGDAGIGKTRLLDELADAARWRGVDVVAAGTDEHVPARPLAPFDAALAAAFDDVRAEQARSHLAPDVLRTLTAIVPELGEAGSSDSTPLDAIDAALAWLASLGPHLFLLDDAHWAGADFWPTLAALAPRLRERRLLVAVAARRVEVLDRGLRRTIGDLEAGGAPIVHVAGLSTGEVDQLLRAVGASVDAQVVHERSGGNPLVALAWRDVVDPEDLDGEVAPASMLDAPSHDTSRVTVGARRRIARLDPLARRVVRQAAVLGRSVEYRILAAACAVDVGDVFRHVVDIEGVGLLSRRSGRLTFDHDLVRAAVLDEVDDGERCELHARALDAVAQVQPSDTLRLLGHAEAAGVEAAVVAYAIAAGTDALVQSSYREAERHFSRALELIGAVDDPLARHAALGGRVRARDRLADRAGQGADVGRLLEHAEPLGGSLLEEALVLDAEHRFAIGDLDGALASVERAAGGEVVGWAGPTMPVSAQLARMAAIILRELGRYDESERIARLLLDRLEADGDEYDAALITDVLGGIAWRRGEPHRAAELHRAAADRFAAIGARGAEARALNNVGTALWAIGDDHAAEAVHRRALEVCRSLEDRRGEGDNLDNLGGVSFVRGDFRAAIELYGAALAIRRATDDPWGVSISLSNMGDAHRALGEHGRALELIDESIAVNVAAGVVRNEATTRQSRGLVLADLGRLDEALVDLCVAEEMHRELGDRANLLEVCSGLLDVLVALGRPSAVSDAMATLAADLTDDDAPRSREVAHVSLAAAAHSLGDLDRVRRHAAGAARALDDALAGLAPADAALRRVAVPQHRAALELVERYSRFVDVVLAPVVPDPDVAPGAGVAVRWSVERPDDLLVDDAPARRRQVLLRLVREAADAGAAPTDDELAAALGVSRRTVLRDVDALRAAGRQVATLGRRPEA